MGNKKLKLAEDFHVGGARASFVLAVSSLLWMTVFMDRQVVAVVLQPMKMDLHLTDSQSGWITTALFIGVALFAMPLSFFVDAYSRKKAMGIMALIWSGAMFATGLGHTFFGVFWPQLLVGAAQAGFSAAAMALIATSYPESVRAKKLAIFSLFQIIGISLGLVLGGYLSANHGGWQRPFFVFAIPGLIFGGCAFFLQDYRNTSVSGQSGHTLWQKLHRLLSTPTLVWFYAGYTLFTALAFAVLIWGPALIMRQFAIGEDEAGIFMAATGVCAIPGVLIGGLLADRWQQRHPSGRMGFATWMVLLSTLAVMGALLVAFVFNPERGSDINAWVVFGIALFAFFCTTSAAVNPAVMAATQTVVSREVKGLVWGLGLSIILIFGGAWAPAATGYLSDVYGSESMGLVQALLTMSCLGFLSFFCFRRSSRHYPDDLVVQNSLGSMPSVGTSTHT